MGSGSGGPGGPEPDGLDIRTVPVTDPGDLAAQLPGTGALAWIHRGEGLIGWGEVARVTLPAGQDRFTAAEKWLRGMLDGARVTDQVGLPGSTGPGPGCSRAAGSSSIPTPCAECIPSPAFRP